MKRKLSIRDKLRIFIWFMREHGNHSLIANCEYCKSTSISRKAFASENGVYTAKYECMRCKATADVVENWHLPAGLRSTEST